MIEIYFTHSLIWLGVIFFYKNTKKLQIIGKEKISRITFQFLAISFIFEFSMYIIFLRIVAEKIYYDIIFRVIVLLKLEIHKSIVEKAKIKISLNFYIKNFIFWYSFIFFDKLICFSNNIIEEKDIKIEILLNKSIIYVSGNSIVSFLILLLGKLNIEEDKKIKFY